MKEILAIILVAVAFIVVPNWDYGPEGVFWGGPWNICPAMYWKEDYDEA